MTYIASVYWNNNNNNHRTIDGEIVSIVVYRYFITIIIFFKQILNPEQERCEQRRVDLVDPRTGFALVLLRERKLSKYFSPFH